VEQIDSGQIHLWLAYLGKTTDPKLLAEHRSLLSKEELEKQARFHFERDRHRYLVTRAMVRTVLSRYANVTPREWRFLFNPFGKPSIAAEHVAARGIEFNVSHTDGLVVMGITRERAVGVDVENVRTGLADVGIADSYFAPQEVAALRVLPREKQNQRFFEYWTLKESYIKARGMGLSIPLDRFAFDLGDSEGIRLTIDPSLRDQPEHWAFWRLKLMPDHLVAVCTAHFGDERLDLPPVRRWP
jgi:4'-phosphopantetheinyl transferase